jgi:hypothetical protein
MEKEIWVPVNFKNCCSERWLPYVGVNYEVSNLGRIRNKKTGNIIAVSYYGYDHAAVFISHKQLEKNGYNQSLIFRVSHVVYGSFIGKCYGKKVYHRDGNTWNNELSNLYMK